MRPSRITVTASETAAISLSLWEIMIDVIPRPLRPFISRSRFSESSSFSADVGLIQDQQLDVLRQRFRDLDQLLLAHAQVLHRHVRVDVEAHASEQVAAAAPSLAPVDETTGDDLVAEEDVLGDGELGDEGELLVDDDDAGALRGLDVLERHLLALEHDLPAVGAVGVHAGQHLHERRLPGAVLPADRVDVAAADGHRDVVERADPREQLGDVPHLENCVRIDHLYLRPLIECHRAVALPSR